LDKKKATAEFRLFWGEKSVTTKFKDGSIVQILDWTDPGAKGDNVSSDLACLIPATESQSANNVITQPFEQVVDYLLKKYNQAAAPESTFFTAFTSTNDEPFRTMFNGFEVLAGDIRAIEGLPIHIRQVSAAGPDLRYTSSMLPLPAHEKGQNMEYADVVIQFESTGRWPDNLVAVQETKISMLIKLAELLQESVDGLKARIGLENEHSNILNASFLDILYPSGLKYRVRIHHDREKALLEGLIKDRSIAPKVRDEAVIGLLEYNRVFVQASLHTQAIRTLCTRNPQLSGSIRLVKKWFASNFLSSHIEPELIELLVVHVFQKPYPWRAPSSVITGFLRTLLFLSRWDWSRRPLIVDIGGVVTPQLVEEVDAKFEAMRKLDPAMNKYVLYVTTSHDPSGDVWTSRKPSKEAAIWMRTLATKAIDYVKQSGQDCDPRKMLPLPVHSYDFVVHLSSEAIKNGTEAPKYQSSEFKNLRRDVIANVKLADSNAVELFLEELRVCYVFTRPLAFEKLIEDRLYMEAAFYCFTIAYSRLQLEGCGTAS
jgi:U3 small nucleolar RNA-associated protein 22